jgi:hypothetical protein
MCYELQQFEIPSVDKGFGLPDAEQIRIEYNAIKMGRRESVVRLHLCYIIDGSFTLIKSRPLKLLNPSVKHTDYLTLALLKWKELSKCLSFALHTIAYIGRNTKLCYQNRIKFIKNYSIIFWLVHIWTAKSIHQLHVIFPVLRAEAILLIFIFLNYFDIRVPHFRVIMDKKQQTHHVKTYAHY